MNFKKCDLSEHSKIHQLEAGTGNHGVKDSKETEVDLAKEKLTENIHKDEKPLKCNELTNASPQIRNKIKKFECSICSKMFRFKDIMQLQKDDHKNVHGGKPFYCELCGLDFQMEEDLNITQV